MTGKMFKTGNGNQKQISGIKTYTHSTHVNM
jgi:hypothetical protein